ncbi:MAG TPA: diacylglycerol kinase family protein [Longimicrobiales bacterium]
MKSWPRSAGTANEPAARESDLLSHSVRDLGSAPVSVRDALHAAERRIGEADRVVVILNPVAGGGRARRLRAEIERELEARRIGFSLERTEGPGHARELARAAATNGASVVVAAGGDGTVHEVVNGLLGAAAEQPRAPTLAVLPVGTGNDFVKAIYPSSARVRTYRALDGGLIRRLDVGRAEWDGQVEYFVNGLGTGVDVEVVRRIARLPPLPGVLRYLVAAIQALRGFRPVPLRVSLDGHGLEQRAMLFAVGNGPCQGGGFFLTPEAAPDDERFDVCIVDELSYVEIAAVLPRVMRGSHGRSPKVKMKRARTIVVEGPAGAPLFFQMDGELREARETPVRVQIAPAVLPVLAPAGGGRP